jgi:putative NADH-flavin reductase
MKIVIFGSTGRLGKELVKHALEKGHFVTAFARDIENITTTHEKLCKVKGSIENGPEVFHALEGQDVVLSALGDKVSGQHTSFRRDAMKQILAAMQLQGVKRIITVGGLGVLQENEDHLICENPLFPQQFKFVSDDHRKTYEFLKASEVTWTMVCPPMIDEAPATGNYRTKAIYHPGGNRITAGDLADFMVTELVKNAFVKTRVGIAGN